MIIITIKPQARPPRYRRLVPTVLVLLVATSVGVVVALCLGEPVATPWSAVSAIGDPGDPLNVPVVQVRLPRALLGIAAGAALAVAGLLMQDALRNPIAGPELLGVSSGAAVVMTAVIVLGIGIPLAGLPYAALLGAFTAGGLVLLAIGRLRSPEHVILVGAAVSAAGAGLVVALIGLGTQGNVVLLFRYLLGSLAARSWSHLEVVGPWIALGLVAAVLVSTRVETLSLGDEAATGLGVHVVRTRVVALLLAAVLAAVVASVCGPIAYVALLAPHVARRLTRSVSTSMVLGPTALVGALLLMAADLVSRLILYPVEVPVGVATTLIGVPALVLALRGRAS